MLSILGTLVGLFGSFIPELLGYFKRKQDHKHEKEMFDLQIKLASTQHAHRVDELNITADIEESKAVYKQAEQKITGFKFFDALISLYNGSVRPTVTYAFVVFYGLVKYAQYNIAVAAGQDGWDIVVNLWNQEDNVAFMTILGFWFGGRLIKHFTQHYSQAK